MLLRVESCCTIERKKKKKGHEIIKIKNKNRRHELFPLFTIICNVAILN